MSGKALFRRYGWTLPTIDSLGLGRASFSAITYTANNDGGTATIGVDRTGGANGVLRVSYATQPGTAIAGIDYQPVQGMLTWANGDAARKFFTVPIIDTLEQTGTVTVLLSLIASDSLLGDRRTAVLQINRDLIQTAITPSDDLLLDPIPYAGIFAPNGGRVALEGSDGGVVVLDLAPGSTFTGMYPRRVLETGTDAGIVLFGLNRPGQIGPSANAGDRVLLVVPSDVDPLPIPALGGFYLPNGGAITFTTEGGVEQVVLPPRTAYRSGAVLRISATGTDAEPIYAFVREINVGPQRLVFSDTGDRLVFSDFGKPLTFFDDDIPQESTLTFGAFGAPIVFSATGIQLRFTT
ncbi:MAG: hypothetical protein C0434_08055 [Xanthomonadaceae bacterium]|nr:hypothetical protein [Xanthomonadaceae bacterium]